MIHLGLLLIGMLLGFGDTAEPPPVFPAAFAWEWSLRPIETPRGRAPDGEALLGDGVLAMMDVDRDGQLRVVLVENRLAAGTRDVVEQRPVGFDAAGQRYPFANYRSFSNESLWVGTFLLAKDTIPLERVTHWGIERLTRSGQKQISEKASKEALREGFDVLPFPEVGQPFEFSLMALDGRKVASSDYRGKVLLVDCWATWCSPCMQKMPELKELLTKWQDKGLAIVGVTLDENREEAEAAIRKHGLGWPQVQAPAEERHRALWHEASTVRTLPRLFLIDRKGILRYDTNPWEMKERIEAMMAAVPERQGGP